MQKNSTAQQGGAAFIWKWGAIYGVILGVIHIILSQLPHKTILDLLMWLIGFFLIGMFAARQTGRVETGVLVGLITGLISGLIVVLFGIIQMTGNNPQITKALNLAAQKAQQHGKTLSLTELRTLAIVGGLIVTEAMEIGLGSGIGALGGLLGRRLARPHTN
jgi:vacuolar-type H+-ATPase subunit I/STV1